MARWCAWKKESVLVDSVTSCEDYKDICSLRPVLDTHREFRPDVWNETEVHSTVVYSNKFVDHRLVSPL